MTAIRSRCAAGLALIVAVASGAPPAEAANSVLQVVDAWSRPAFGTGVVYATIVNRGSRPDRLIEASSPIARSVELHESETSSSPGGMAMGGEVTAMHRVDAVTVPGGGALRLAPGGYHLMLIGLRHDLKSGDAVPIRLHFARDGWISTTARVRGM